MNKLLPPKTSNCKIFEEWYEYDEKGNQIHQKNTDEDESWFEYDEKGNIIYKKTLHKPQKKV